MEEKNIKKAEAVYDWLDSIIFALVFVMLLFSFVLKTYIVDGYSMYPTLKDGSRVFAYSLFYTPTQGDIVVIDENNGYNAPLVKRVVAVGGQTVDVDRESFEVTVDGVPFKTPVEDGEGNLKGDTEFPLTVPEGYIFVMGDNRGDSFDSRYDRIGFIDERSVLGKEIFEIQ